MALAATSGITGQLALPASPRYVPAARPPPARELPLVSPSLVAVSPQPGTAPLGTEPEMIYSSTADA